MPKNHYDLLGVARNAPPEVVAAAYRALAQKYDRPNDAGADAQMASLRTAAAMLMNADKRRAYDGWLDAQASARTPTPPVNQPARKQQLWLAAGLPPQRTPPEASAMKWGIVLALLALVGFLFAKGLAGKDWGGVIFWGGICVISLCIIGIVPFWRIFKLAGFSGAWSLLLAIPWVGLAALWTLAFVKWPNDTQDRTHTAPGFIVFGALLVPVAMIVSWLLHILVNQGSGSAGEMLFFIFGAAILLAAGIAPLWRIFTLAGFAGVWSLLLLVPWVGVLTPWVLSFMKWPSDSQNRTQTDKGFIALGAILLVVGLMLAPIMFILSGSTSQSAHAANFNPSSAVLVGSIENDRRYSPEIENALENAPAYDPNAHAAHIMQFERARDTGKLKTILARAPFPDGTEVFEWSSKLTLFSDEFWIGNGAVWIYVKNQYSHGIDAIEFKYQEDCGKSPSSPLYMVYLQQPINPGSDAIIAVRAGSAFKSADDYYRDASYCFSITKFFEKRS